MSKQKKPDLSRTDAFQRAFLQLSHWVKHNARQITIVVAPLVVVVVAVIVGQVYLKGQKNKRLAALAAINRVYADEQQAVAERRSTLQEKIKELESGKKPERSTAELESGRELESGDQPVDKGELETQLKAIRADHSRSSEQYREFFAAHQTSPEGWSAAMSAIGIAIASKQYDTAQELLTTLLQHSTKNDFYQVQARLLYIKLLEEQGNLAQALTETEQIYHLAPQDFKPEALLIKARLLLAQQQNSAARAVCEEIIQDFADSHAAVKARAIKVLLN